MELATALNEIAGLRAENQTLRANLETVQFQLAQLQRMIFGHRREQLNIEAHTGLLFEVAKTSKTPGLAHEAVARIAAFYQLDNGWKELVPDERRRRREEEIQPLLEDFHAWMAAHLSGLLPQSPLAKAMAYAANHWGALTRFLDDGRLPLDNNAAERALRPIAISSTPMPICAMC